MYETPSIRWDHLGAMTGEMGLYEHAEFETPRVSHGYTTDDNGRALVVLTGPFNDVPPPNIERYLQYVTSGRVPSGWHNRMSDSGVWTDVRGSDDAHGRALWGLGVALANGYTDTDTAAAFHAGLDLESRYSRANCYAILGAARANAAGIFTVETEGFLSRIRERLPQPGAVDSWVWPEPRLTYDNARLPQAFLAAGAVLADDGMIQDGLRLLDWLVDTETRNDSFSFTPVGGRRPGQFAPAFDQQPLEAWAMADACLEALMVGGGSMWLEPLERAVAWLSGHNDTGVALYDPETGACADGLTPHGRNENRGAESTLSAIGAIQARLAADRMLMPVR